MISAGNALAPGPGNGEKTTFRWWPCLMIQIPPARTPTSFALPPHFYDSLSCQKAILWPGSKGVARKKHRREKNSIRRSPRASAERGGPVGDPPDRPYADSTRGCASGAVPARPKKWNAPHDFSAQRPCFLAGHPLKFNRSDANLAKSEGGQGEFAY